MLDSLQNFISPVYFLQIVVLLLSLSIHEFCHAYVAYRLGDDTAARQGRLSLNPLVHLDPVGTLMIVMGAPVGWARPVPVYPPNFTRRYRMKTGMALVAVAGPVSNLILSLFGALLVNSLTLFMRLGYLGESTVLVYSLLLGSVIYRTNLYLAVFNLIPAPPLDGSKILGIFLKDAWWQKLMMYERYIGLAFLAFVLFFRSGLHAVLTILAKPFEFLLLKPLEWLFLQLYFLLR